MKKRLEAELISIAHRVLKLKNRSETVQLQREAKKLYEQLTILRFYEENINVVSAEISEDEMEQKLFIEQKQDKQIEVAEVVSVIENEEVESEIEEQHLEEIHEEPVEEELAEEQSLEEQSTVEEIVLEEEKTESKSDKEELASVDYINSIVAEMTNVKPKVDEVILQESDLKEEVVENVVEEIKEESKPEENKPKQISFDELLQHAYTEPDFVKVDEVKKEIEKPQETLFEKVEEIIEQPKVVVEDIITEIKAVEETIVEEIKIEETKPVEDLSFRKEMVLDLKKSLGDESKSVSLNDKFNKSIVFGLNDRIGFEKKLFNGSTDDFNRVVSQLNTLDTFEEAKAFIENFVKPDYNNWEGKEEFETRFLEIVEKKFN